MMIVSKFVKTCLYSFRVHIREKGTLIHNDQRTRDGVCKINDLASM